MQIATRTGDSGTTGLYSTTKRLPKSHPLMCLLGNLDELNSHLGLILSLSPSSQTRTVINFVQEKLFQISAQVAGSLSFHLKKSATTRLETWINQLEAELPPLRHFVFPGGTPAAAHLFLARAVCRRTERSSCRLKKLPISPSLLPFLNRLSDLLFLLARHENHKSHLSETLWQGRG